MIVRCIQRLEELCREVRNGARTIGDFNTTSKMEQCSEAIRRDIVFAASLYTQEWKLFAFLQIARIKFLKLEIMFKTFGLIKHFHSDSVLFIAR